MYDFLRRHHRKFIALLLILLPIIMISTSAGATIGTSSRGVASLAQHGMGWVQFTGYQVMAGIGNWFSFLGDSSSRDKEQQLQGELARLREEKTLLIGVLQENARLREMVEMRARYPDYILAPARVIGRDISPYFRVIKVQIQSDTPLEPRMPVVVPGGVVGQIHKVYDDYADIVLVADPRSRIDALSQRNRAQGIVQGLGRERDYFARVSYLSQKDEVREGDVMVTSGMGGIFPKELIVGTITQIFHAEQGLFQEVWLEPAVDFSRLEEVFVIVAER